MKNINSRATLSFTLLIFLITASQLSLASPNSTSTIPASGIIKENAVESARIRKHLRAYGFRSSLLEERVQHFAKFDVLDTGFEIGPDVARIKALNPNIIILGYKDIMFIHTFYPDYPEVDAHEDWFLHDINGNRLINEYWGCYAMDVGNAGWRSHYANYVKDELDNFPFDGVFADSVWDPFFAGSGWNPWTVPIEDVPVEIKDRWYGDMLGMISFVKELIGEKLLIINTPNNSDYVDACDGKMDEGFVHPPWYNLDEFDDAYINWKGQVDSLKNISQSGKYYLAHSGTLIPENATEADLDKVHDMMIYCFASYLLGTSGEKATFGFNNIWSEDGSRGYYTEFDVSLGSPVNEYYSIGSVYARDFAKGKVLVNPTTSSYTVNLDSEYETLYGQIVYSVTLDAHSGLILLSP